MSPKAYLAVVALMSALGLLSAISLSGVRISHAYMYVYP